MLIKDANEIYTDGHLHVKLFGFPNIERVTIENFTSKKKWKNEPIHGFIDTVELQCKPYLPSMNKTWKSKI